MHSSAQAHALTLLLLLPLPSAVADETRLGTAPADQLRASLSGLTVSADDRRYAYTEKTDGGERVVLDGKPGPTFDRIGWIFGPSLEFSGDGKHFGYVGLKGSQAVPVIDGVSGPAVSADKGYNVQFSPDGRHSAYTVESKIGAYYVIDGNPTPNGELARYVSWSPDGRRMAYWLKKGGKEHVVIDGVPGKDYDSANSPIWSKTGAHFGYAAKQGDTALVVFDGKEGRAYAKIGGTQTVGAPFSLTADGARMAYAAVKTDGGATLVIDNQTDPPTENGTFPQIGGIAWSPTGTRIALVIGDGGNDQVAVGIAGKDDAPPPPDPKPYPEIKPATVQFSADGRRMGYVATRKKGTGFDDTGAEEVVIIDGKEQTPYPATSSLLNGGFSNAVSFSPVGAGVAFLTRHADGKMAVLRDGKEGTSYEMIGQDYVGPMLTWSADGKHLAYPATRAGKAYLIVDGKESAAYDGFLSGAKLLWEGPAAVILAYRGDQVYRVTAPAP